MDVSLPNIIFMEPILENNESTVSQNLGFAERFKSTKVFSLFHSTFNFFKNRVYHLSKALGINKSLVYKYSVPLFLISFASFVLFSSTMALLVKSNFNNAGDSINEFVSTNLKSEVSERLSKELEAHEKIVEGELNAWVEKAATIAQSPAFFSGDLINISLYSKEIIKNNTDVLEIIILDQEGKSKFSSYDPISSSFDGQALSFDGQKIIEELSDNSKYKSEILLNEAPYFSFIQVGYPILNHNGKLQEGLVLICKMNLFQDLSEQEDDSYTVLNNEAQILSKTNVSDQNDKVSVGDYYADKYTLDEQSNQKGNFFSLDGSKLITYSKSDLGVTFLSEIPVEKALAVVNQNEKNTEKAIGGSFNRILKSIALLALLIVALASIIGFWLAKSLVGPIRRLILGTLEVAKGNFNVKLEKSSVDEIGDLTDTFNLMTNTLSNQKGNLEIHNETIQNQTERLAMSNAELEQYAKTISNDLKEPLQNISYYQSILSNKLNNDENLEEKKYLKEIKDSVNNMKKMIDELFSYAQYNKQLETCLLTRTELNILVDVALKNLNYKLISNKVTVHVEQLPFVEVQAPLIISLFQNLINNCMANRIDSKRLRIEIYAELLENKHWRINIRDNGKGYSSDESKNLFTVFRQLSASPDTDMTYGLALCRKIILYHGGKIGVDSKPGEGTTYYFTLPAKTKSKTTQNNSTGPNVNSATAA